MGYYFTTKGVGWGNGLFSPLRLDNLHCYSQIKVWIDSLKINLQHTTHIYKLKVFAVNMPFFRGFL